LNEQFTTCRGARRYLIPRAGGYRLVYPFFRSGKMMPIGTTKLTIRNGAIVCRGHCQDYGCSGPPYASAGLKSLFELTTIANDFDGDVAAAVNAASNASIERDRQRRPHGAFFNSNVGGPFDQLAD
jgi:hypothetical protein